MITIKTQMTRDFFVKEYVKLLYGKWTTYLVLSLGFICFILFFIDLFVLDKFNGYILLNASLLTFLQPIFHYIYAIKFYNSSTFIKETSTYTIDETSVEQHSNSANCILKWENIFKTYENSSLFLLYENKYQAHYIPKKDMTAEQIAYLQGLIKTVTLEKIPT